jgi:hypothetical protein
MSNLAIHQKVIKNKLGVLKLAETLGNVSHACKMMGYSRDSVIDMAYLNLVKRALRIELKSFASILI